MLDLNSFTLDELKALKEDVEDAIERQQTELREMARKEIMAIAAEHGVSMDELLSRTQKTTGKAKKRTGGNGKKLSPGIPKYFNPANPTQTWTGKGKKPMWFIQAVMHDKLPPDQLLIQ